MDLSDPELARELLAQAPVIALLLDTEGRVDYINPWGERLTGHSAADLVGQDWFATLLPAAEQPASRQRFLDVVAGSPPRGIVHPILTRDGALISVEWSGQRLLGASGAVRGLLAIGRDVTERLRAEANLRDSERRYRQLFDASPQPMWVYDRETLAFLAVNDAAVAHYGYAREQFLAMTMRDIRPAEDLARLEAAVAANSAGIEQSSNWRHRLADGRLIEVDVSSHDLPFEGRPARLVQVSDVSVQRQAERERERLLAELKHLNGDAVADRDLLNSVLERVDDGFVALDTDWHYTYMNQRAATLLGRDSPEDLLGRHIWTEFPEGVGQPVHAAYLRAMATQQPELLESHYAPWDRWFENRIYPSPDGLSVYFTDISARKHAEAALASQQGDLERLVLERTRQLEAARDEAQVANQAKSQFLSRMSHELRTPMNAILGFGQLLGMESSLGARQQERVAEILRAGRHLLSLIDDVLDLARIESGGVTLSPEALVLADLVDEALRMTQGLAQARSIRIDLAGVDGVIVRADRVRLRQVLLNLLTNAVKYNREAGLVSVSAANAAAADRVRLVVADTGAGIAAARLPELFKPFQRLGAEFSEVEGTGIGLTIARQLIELMGGQIGVDSQVGVGSRFWIELPAAQLSPPPAPIDSAPAQAPASATHSATVLYVEDNPANL
ncbi:MAG: PAS domain S-box protein, partial [Rubrivivax sp.]|nr:PAS domain S-box protein [Rubrivivax sp.]